MSLPEHIPTFDREESIFGVDIIFTDIPVDPTSLPTPAAEANTFVATGNGWLDEEEEEEEEEMDEDESSDESEDEPEEAIAPAPTYTPRNSGPRTMLTARKSVRFPSTDYASTSRASGSRTFRTARKSVIRPRSIFSTSSPSPSPTPSSVPSSPVSSHHVSETPPTVQLAPASPTYAPMSDTEWDEQLAAEPAHAPSPTYTPGEPYAPVPTPRSPVVYPGVTPPASPQYTPASPQYTPSTPPPAFPPTTAEDLAWNDYMHPIPPVTIRASTSAPPIPEDTTMTMLTSRVDTHGLRIDQLEDTVEVLAGPVQIEELSDQVMDLDDRVYFVEHRSHQLSERVLAPGGMADQFHMFHARLRAVETERDFLRSRVRDMEQTIFGIHRATR